MTGPTRPASPRFLPDVPGVPEAEGGGAAVFVWGWGGRTVRVEYEVLAPRDAHAEAEAERVVLLLPAFSTVSSRDEMRPLAARLAARGFRCIVPDWPGFGGSTRGRLGYGPALYQAFLGDFARALLPREASVVAAGHASGYALTVGKQRAGLWGRIVLLAPTWRGPLPTAMGPRPRTYGFARALVRAPVIGPGVYRLNTAGRIIGMMYRRHVFADAARITPDFVRGKQRHARAPGARFASVAFVTGALDPVADRAAFHALLAPPSAPTLILCGEATPPKSRAEMDAIPTAAGVTLRWVEGSLGLNEEQAAAIAEPIAAFLEG